MSAAAVSAPLAGAAMQLTEAWVTAAGGAGGRQRQRKHSPARSAASATPRPQELALRSQSMKLERTCARAAFSLPESVCTNAFSDEAREHLHGAPFSDNILVDSRCELYDVSASGTYIGRRAYRA
jgi:hypothetical protein